MKKFLALILALMFIFSLAACGQSAPTAEAPAQQPEPAPASEPAAEPSAEQTDPALEEYYYFSLGSTTPSNNPIIPYVEEALAQIEADTDGHVVIELFPDSSIGTETDMVNMLQTGELEMLHTGIMAKLVINEYGFLTGYWWMQDMDHFWNVWNSEIGDRYHAVMEEDYNIHEIDATLLGLHNLLSQKEIKTVDDFNGRKLRLAANPAAAQLWESLGVNINIMGMGEVMTSLQTGVLDSFEHTYITMQTFSMWEVAQYLYETEHEADVTCFYINNDIWNSLPEQYQQAIEKAFAACCDGYDKYRDENMALAKQDLLDNGIVEIEVTPEFRAQIVEKMQPTLENLFDTTWTGATYEEVMSYAG